MPENEPQRSADYVLGRVEARVEGVEARVDRLETTTAARLLGIETKLEIVVSALASRAGGLQMASSFGQWARWAWVPVIGAVGWAIDHWRLLGP